MAAFSATPDKTVRNIVILITNGAVLLDATGPIQAFHEARDSQGRPLYKTTVASPDGGGVMLDCGVSIMSQPIYDIDIETIDTLLVTGADNDFEALADERLITWLTEAKKRIRRIGSICIGAFLLAEAGLLDGGNVVTHWRWCDRLSAKFPAVTVLPDHIYVRYGNIWTSAGVTSGIDMSLAMIEEDQGKAVALDVARTLVVFLRRPGGQSQFSVPLSAEYKDQAGMFEELHQWIGDNIARHIDVHVLAERMGMSPRNFARQYRKSVGDTPANVIRKIRVERARQMLDTTEYRVSVVAHRCGFTDVEPMRRVFLKDIGVAPSDYRDMFRSAVRASATKTNPVIRISETDTAPA